MSAAKRIVLLIAGYAGAIALGVLFTVLYSGATAGPDRQASAGMYAFGDGVVFLCAFGFAAIAPTSFGLFWLRPFPWAWRVLGTVSVFVACTGVLAAGVYASGRMAQPGSFLTGYSGIAVIRLLVAPLFAGAALLCGVFSPARGWRFALFAASFAEAATFAVFLAALLLGAP